MALAVVTTKASVHDVVCVFDPDVTAPDEYVGWIPATDASAVADSATVLTVRGLNIDERARSFGKDGAFAQALERSRLGLVAVDGKRGKACRRFLSGIADDGLYFLLGVYIDAITRGRDPQELQQRLLGADDDDDDEEGEADADMKSG